MWSRGSCLEYDGAGLRAGPGSRGADGARGARAGAGALCCASSCAADGGRAHRCGRARLGAGRLVLRCAGRVGAVAECPAARPTWRCCRRSAAPEGFDARRDATSRAYCYRVLVRRARAASSAGGRCGGRTPSTSTRYSSVRRRWSASTTSPRSRRPTPTTCASRGRCYARTGGSVPGGAPGVLDRGRRVHAPDEPRAGRDDARGRRRAAVGGDFVGCWPGGRARAPGGRRRRTGCTWPASGTGASECCFVTRRRAGAASVDNSATNRRVITRWLGVGGASLAGDGLRTRCKTQQSPPRLAARAT